MTEVERKRQSLSFFRRAFEAQNQGDWIEAVNFYQKSIQAYPTAEALTFLGWALSFLGKYEEAILACEQAIKLDPAYGNPYNDIGAYLIELDRVDEAVPYLEKAVKAGRDEDAHFAYYNLGRVWLKRGMVRKAMGSFQKALEEEPDYPAAREALERLKYVLN